MYKLFSAYRESLVRWKTRQLKIFSIVNQKKKTNSRATTMHFLLFQEWKAYDRLK